MGTNANNTAKELMDHIFKKTYRPNEEFQTKWSEILNNAISIVYQLQSDGIDTLYSQINSHIWRENPLPFQEILFPFVLVARRKFEEKKSFCRLPISNDALVLLEYHLMKQLSYISSKVLFVSFSLFRNAHLSNLHILCIKPDSLLEKKIYSDFVQKMFSEKYSYLLQEFPELFRLLSIQVDTFINYIDEFLYRLVADLSKISTRFNDDVPLQMIQEITPYLSDPHNNGRTVIRIIFEGGLKLIYKPKNLDLEATFIHFLGWLNIQKPLLDFKTMNILLGANYGWIEYIEHLTCTSKEEISRYYQRAGKLLFIIYMVEGIDCHFENLIAHGEYPVLVDTETLFHPRIINLPIPRAHFDIDYSVIHTGLLRRPFGQKIMCHDISGFTAGINGEKPNYAEIHWENINSDYMHQKKIEYTNETTKNLPLLHDQSISPMQYINEILDGFQDMYIFFMQHKSELICSDSPIHHFQKKHSRFIFRSTKYYRSLLLKSFEPKALRSYEARSNFFKDLNHELRELSKQHPLWQLLEVEQLHLDIMDIPYFSVSSNTIMINGLSLPSESFLTNPYEIVIERIKNLNSEELLLEIKNIHNSFSELESKN
jgi:type 2 lantibiotic biosynthesis protein LanM